MIKTGTFQTAVKDKPSSLSSRSNKIGGGSKPSRGDNSGDGGSGGKGSYRYYPPSTNPSKEKIAMMLLLTMAAITFAALISLYLIVYFNARSSIWKPFTMPYQVWLSTFLLSASSAAYIFFQKKNKSEINAISKRWLMLSAILGGMFVISQISVWTELVNRGVYVKNNPFAGFFYILTAAHVVHVAGGIAAIVYLLMRIRKITFSTAEKKSRQAIAATVGWYWHSMDCLWLVLLFLLSFAI